jgi:hypothetical protein
MRDKYPLNWKAISDRIRFERAGGQCECAGECGANHYRRVQEVQCRDGRPGVQYGDRRCTSFHGRSSPQTGSKVVLTVAHLDHDPTNCSDDNLRAMCQRCHLTYDRDHHAETRKGRRP